MDWRGGGRPLVGGHRGANAVAPENTYAGFRFALAAGVDYVETDVRRAADGTLVLFHDDRLERTTDGRGRVEARDPAELAGLDAGAWFAPRFAGERIPTLDGFLAWLEQTGSVGAILEAKGAGTGGPLAVRLRASPAAARLAICGFSPVELRAARAGRPDGVVILLLDLDDIAGRDPVELTRAAEADGAALIGRALTRRRHGALRDAGLLVGAGTRTRPVAARRVMELGVDCVDSDRPTVLVRARERWVEARAARGDRIVRDG